MRCRSWHAAKVLGSPCARLTVNTVAQAACSQHLPEGLLPPGGLVLLGVKNVVLPIPWSKQEGVGCVAFLPMGFHTSIPMGEKGSVLHLSLDTVSEEKSDLDRGSFQILSMQHEGKSHACSTGAFSALVLGTHLLCYASPC